MRFVLLTLIGVLLVNSASSVQVPPQEKRAVEHYNLDDDGLALQGYDPVAYFHEGGGKPEKGNAKITATYHGVTYRFVTARHREMFLKTPDRFEPAYGGWCAYAFGTSDDKVEIDPNYFVIQQGRLLLFYKSFFANTRNKWIEEPKALLEKANATWHKLSGETFLPHAGLQNLDEGNIAIMGYDPVSYFEEGGGKPALGKPEVTFKHNDAVYYFAKPEHRELFAKTPERFAPAFGGWCAYGLALKNGEKYPVDPLKFRIQGERLLLFYADDETDASAIWVQDENNLLQLADKNWEDQRGRP